MKIMIWNCRGLGNPRAIPILIELLRAHRPDVVFLFETLVCSARIEVIKARIGFESFFYVNCNGHNGGVCAF